MRISDWSSDVCSSDLQFGKDRDVSGAISAQVKFNDLAILFDICEPGRTPADLPFHSDDATASDFLHEGPDTRDCVVIVNGCDVCAVAHRNRSEEHTSELQSLMRISYAVFCLKKKNTIVYSIHMQTKDTFNTTTII